MEDYVRRGEFSQYVQLMKVLKQEVDELRQWKEHHTEPIPAVNVNVASQDVINRLDSLEYTLAQEVKTVSETWLETMQGNYGEHKADFLQLKESQADFRDKLIEQSTKLDKIEATQEQILKLLQQKLGE